jgi:hypothetical protein
MGMWDSIIVYPTGRQPQTPQLESIYEDLMILNIIDNQNASEELIFLYINIIN